MTDGFALGRFLTDLGASARHDLTASECETLPLGDLLDLAGPDDRRRWDDLTLAYADPRGAPWLRAAIAARHQDRMADDVLCCAGAQEAISCIARALLARDDHALVVLPIYQPSEHAVTDICAATGIALQPPQWRLDLDRIAAAIRPNTRLILMNFPNSPTGAALTAATMRDLIALCRHHGLWLVNDEVYRSTEPDPAARQPHIADLYERGISVNAMSKAFGLPGLRVGWMVARDAALLAKVMVHKSGLSSSLAAPSEVLAHIALQAEQPIIARNLAIAAENRRCWEAVADGHRDLFETAVPAQAAWAFPRYRGEEGADRFARELARATGVLVLPSTLWRSPLAEMPLDYVRIGLGKTGFAKAVEASAGFLSAGVCPPADA